MKSSIKKIVFAIMALVLLLQQFLTLPLDVMAESLTESNEFVIESLSFRNEEGDILEEGKPEESVFLNINWKSPGREETTHTPIVLSEKLVVEPSSNKELHDVNGDEVGTYKTSEQGIEVTIEAGEDSQGELSIPVRLSQLEPGVHTFNVSIGNKVSSVTLMITNESVIQEGNKDTAVLTEQPDVQDNEIEEPIEIIEEEQEDIEEPEISVLEAIERNLSTSFSFVINPGANQMVVENNAELDVNLAEMNAVQLFYGIAIPNDMDVATGDTYTIDLPTIYQAAQPVENIPIVVEGLEVGTYSIVDNQVVVTFNENANSLDDTEMNVDITGSFNTDVFEVENEVLVNVPFNDGTSYTATIRAEQQEYDGTDVKEAGSPYILNEAGERVVVDRNPEFIDWTVRVNDSMNSIENARVIDELGDNLEIEEGSFIVERIIRNYQNEETGRETVDVIPEMTEFGFELNLESIEDAYDITYTTRVTRPDGGGTYSINNNARIVLDGDTNTVSDEFEGTWSGDIPTVTKEGAISEERSDIINWTVEYNFGQESLGEVSLTDTLTHGDVDLDTVVVTRVETDIDGNIVDGSENTVDITPEITEDGMIIPGLDAEGYAYLITFSSSVPAGLNDTVINEIADDLPNPNVDDASVNVNTIPTGGKVGEQHVDEAGQPYIEWTITMNEEKVDVNSIRLADVFDPEYLTFDVDDASLYGLFREGEAVENFAIDNYEHDDGRSGFTLHVEDVGPYTYEFVYRTYYTVAGMQQPELANHAELIFEDGNGEGIGDPFEMTIGQTGPRAGIQKSGKYIRTEENTEQEIEWTVRFNNSRILLEEGTTLTDIFRSENYEYIDGSLNLSTGEGSNLDYALAENDDGFVITLNEDTNETITVTFRTTTDDTNNLEHVNNAVLDWQGGKEEDSATVGMRNPGINKSGEVVINDDGSKTVNWTVNFNTDRHILQNVVISENLEPSTSDISDIQVSRDGTPLGEEEYTVSKPGAEGESFTVEIDRLDAVPYQLTYSSTLSPEEEIENISNTVGIDYTGGNQNTESSIPSPELGVQKEAVSLDKESGRISWSIVANTDARNSFVNLVSPVLSDTIPSDQELVQGSIEVVRKDTGANVTDITINEGTNDFSINLPDGPYQYIVTFQTEILEYPSVNTQLDRYTNTTTLSNQNYEDVSDDAYIDYFADGSNNNNAKTGEVNDDTENIDWQATVNPLGLTINNVLITDALSDNQTYVEDSIEVTDENGEDLPDGTYELTVSDDNQSFTVEFLGDGQINQPINVSYSTRLNPELIGFYEVSNTVNLLGGEEQRELSSTTESTSTSQWSYGGGGSGRTLEFMLNKLHEGGEVPIAGAEFEFIRYTPTGTEVPLDNIVTTGDDGSFLIENVRAGRYRVTEKAVPEGYARLSESFHIIIGYSTPEEIEAGAGEYQVTVTDADWEPINSSVASAEGNTLTVYNAVETGEVEALKRWGGAEQSSYPETWFQLYRQLPEGEAEEVPNADIRQLDSDSQSETVIWEDMDLYSPEGKKYEFFVQEVDAEGENFTPEGYIKLEEGLEIINFPVEPVSIQATKELTGRPLQVGEFEFELRDSNDNLVSEAVNQSNGAVDFTVDLTAEQRNRLQEKGSLTIPYTISERQLDTDGITFDTATFDVIVEINMNRDTGSLDMSVEYPEGQANFTNTYTPAPDSVVIEARKVLEGLDLEADQFRFELVEGEEVLQTVPNNAEGQIIFNEITYDEVGEHVYTIREVQDDLSGMTYDTNTFEVRVSVNDNGIGHLEAEVFYEDGPIEFRNTYTPAPDSVVLEASKVLEGQTLRAGQFNFELLDESGNVIQTVSNNGEGQVIFDEITYSEAGEHSYTIREVEGTQGAMTYDNEEFEVIVSVTDDGVGTLTATVHYVDGPAVFTNIYTPAPDSVVLEASKVLEGKALRADQFNFELLDESGSVIQTVSNNGEGQVIFDEITYSEAGEHTYTIREVEGIQGGVTYDSTEFEVRVTVIDDGEGTLTASADYVEGPAIFNNIYTPAPDSVVLEASKVLEGQALRDGQFEFELLDESGNVIETVSNNARGQIIFDEITYDEVGEYNYAIREVEGNQGGVTYDDSVFGVTVTVIDDGEGQLVATEIYSEQEVVFTNSYEANSDSVILEATKTLIGQDLSSGQFEFALIDSEGVIIQTVENNQHGQIIFDEITYDEVGEYNYAIREVEGNQGGVTYDDSVFGVTVTVIDDGEGQLAAEATYVNGSADFVNTYEEPSDPHDPEDPKDSEETGDPEDPDTDEHLPQTGVELSSPLWIGLGLLLISGGAVVINKERKKP